MSIQNRFEFVRQLVHLDVSLFPSHGILNGKCTCGDPNCKSPGKHPATRRSFADATKDLALLMLRDWTRFNIGVATGEISKLLVIDVDNHGNDSGTKSLLSLERKLGALPRQAAVTTGGGGLHFWFELPEGMNFTKFVVDEGIEVFANRSFVVGPGSIHRSGKSYEWFMGAPNKIPPLPDSWLAHLMQTGGRKISYSDTDFEGRLIDLPNDFQGRTQDKLNDLIEVIPKRFKSSKKATAMPSIEGLFPDASIRARIMKAIELTVPTKPGTRHKQLFELCRKLSFILETPPSDMAQLRPVVDFWFERLLSELGEENVNADSEENWFDFLDSYPRVTRPAEEDGFRNALTKALEAPVPPFARSFRGESSVLLCKLVVELARRSESREFFLSVRTAADACNFQNLTLAHGSIKALKGLGVIEEREKGTLNSRKASVYRLRIEP